MLLIQTYLDKSPIQGIGLFANEDIPAGTVIWKLNETGTKKFTKSYVDDWNHPETFKKFIKTYAWLHKGIYYLCLDDGRFMNHSDESNTLETQYTTVAKIDIKKGEEITCDYKSFCENGTNFNL
jgi:SET domain-containing protein